MRVLLILVPLWIVVLLLWPWSGWAGNPAKPAVGIAQRAPWTTFAGQMSAADICTTVYNCLGIDAQMTVPDRGPAHVDCPRRPADPRNLGGRGAKLRKKWERQIPCTIHCRWVAVVGLMAGIGLGWAADQEKPVKLSKEEQYLVDLANQARREKKLPR